MEEFVAAAQLQLERIKALCTKSGLKYVNLPMQFTGVGVAIGFSQTDYVVLSVMGGGIENQLMITSGILNNIKQDRPAALDAANHFNQNNTAYPVFLHDAKAGWALITQQTHPIELMINVPQYFNTSVRALPRIVIEYRSTIDEKWDLGGQPWSWTEEDRRGLLIRSMV